MVCCVLPLAVSDNPQWQLQDVSIDKFKNSRRNSVEVGNISSQVGDTNQSFENDDGSLQSFGSITRILKKDKRTLRRMKTLSDEEFQKKARNEIDSKRK